MSPDSLPSFASFAAAAAPWQNFYLLVGTGAATLVGLMFVAVTFGSSLVTVETSGSARAFLDPTFTHFVQVLVTACLLVIPTMGPTLFGGILLLIAAGRTANLFRVFRVMKAASDRYHDVDLSDWLSGIAFPLLCYVVIGVAAGAFLGRYLVAFDVLALGVLGLVLLGVFGAWELLVWMALSRVRAASQEQGSTERTR
jgi:hypothetical protein